MRFVLKLELKEGVKIILDAPSHNPPPIRRAQPSTACRGNAAFLRGFRKRTRARRSGIVAGAAALQRPVTEHSVGGNTRPQMHYQIKKAFAHIRYGSRLGTWM